MSKVEHSPQTLGYAIGLLKARELFMQGYTSDIDFNSIAKGVGDFFDKEKSCLMTVEQATNIMDKEFQNIRMNSLEKNKKRAEEFFDQLEKEDDITITESGIFYQILAQGSGAKPLSSDRVTVHYHGTLIDGTVFDSSVERNQPETFGVTQVIVGWQETLVDMKVGEKRRIYLPSHLAYGDHGAGGVIQPGAALVFEIELIAVV